MRIAIYDDPNLTGCTFYRSHLPFSHLHKARAIEVVRVSDRWAPVDFLYLNILFQARPFTQKHFEFMSLAKQSGAKIWIDTDDDLTAIPLTNPAEAMIDPHLENAKKCYQIADLVTVSTDFLGEEIRKKFPGVPIIVLPNVLSLPDKINTNFTGRPTVFWRGSSTHGEDLEEWKDEIIEASHKFIFHWFGRLPFWHNKMSRTIDFDKRVSEGNKEPVTTPAVIYHKWTSMFSYFHKLSNLNLNVMLYPLADNHFNLSKSNIAWQEATFAGAACITNARGAEWTKPGILHDPQILFKEDKRRIREAVKRSRAELSKFTFQNRQERLLQIAAHLAAGKINEL